MDNICKICDSEKVVSLLELGEQPICNRFLKNPEEKEYTHPMNLRQCNDCGTVQLLNSVPVEELLPRYDWIKYNEPEKHLDDLAEKIINLHDINKNSRFLGVSYKEDSTLERLKNRGYENIYRLNLEEDLGIKNKCAGIESIQAKLEPELVNKIIKKHGKFDVVIVRHVLEHTHNTGKFIEALKSLIKPDGYIIFEVPDCAHGFDNLSYTTLWEEHTFYFTPNTFRNFPSYFNLEIIEFILYPYPYENSLVNIVKTGNKNRDSQQFLEREKERIKNFSEKFREKKNSIHRFFSLYRENLGKIAFLGAGHHACSFINFMNLSNHIEFIVDDNPNRQGFYMPGSKLPIYGTDALIKNNIKLCLMGLSPESEEKVMQRNNLFIKNRGVFSSIFPTSKYALNYKIIGGMI